MWIIIWSVSSFALSIDYDFLDLLGLIIVIYVIGERFIQWIDVIYYHFVELF